MKRNEILSVALVALFLLNAYSLRAGGELPATRVRTVQKVRQETRTEELVRHSREVTEALRISNERAWNAAEHERTKYARLTVPLVPAKDRFGDPMYAAYGPRAYADSPMYTGPAYTASFERGEDVVIPDGTYRGYYRGVYSHPGMSIKSDVGTRAAATQSYFQSGMLYSPGSQAPQGDRAMMFNHQLAF